MTEGLVVELKVHVHVTEAFTLACQICELADRPATDECVYEAFELLTRLWDELKQDKLPYDSQISITDAEDVFDWARQRVGITYRDLGCEFEYMSASAHGAAHAFALKVLKAYGTSQHPKTFYDQLGFAADVWEQVVMVLKEDFARPNLQTVTRWLDQEFEALKDTQPKPASNLSPTQVRELCDKLIADLTLFGGMLGSDTSLSPYISETHLGLQDSIIAVMDIIDAWGMKTSDGTPLGYSLSCFEAEPRPDFCDERMAGAQREARALRAEAIRRERSSSVVQVESVFLDDPFADPVPPPATKIAPAAPVPTAPTAQPSAALADSTIFLVVDCRQKWGDGGVHPFYSVEGEDAAGKMLENMGLRFPEVNQNYRYCTMIRASERDVNQRGVIAGFIQSLREWSKDPNGPSPDPALSVDDLKYFKACEKWDAMLHAELTTACATPAALPLSPSPPPAAITSPASEKVKIATGDLEAAIEKISADAIANNVKITIDAVVEKTGWSRGHISQSSPAWNKYVAERKSGKRPKTTSLTPISCPTTFPPPQFNPLRNWTI